MVNIMRRTRFHLVSVWLLLFSGGASFATAAPAAKDQPGPARLEGLIASERGEPLVGAIISVFGANLASGGLITVSDDNGRFHLSGLPPGLYTLRAYLSGFLPSRSSRVELSEMGAEPVLMKLARLDAPESPQTMGSFEDMGEPDNGDRRTSELKWLLRHGKRNVLHQHEQAVVQRVAEDTSTESSPLAPRVDVSGEVGLLASASDVGLSSFPGAGAGLDARLAYARLDIPTGPGQRWEVSAQLMETILSSWAASAQFIMEGSSGHRTSAGVSYGNHLYGDLGDFRPPEAGLGRRSEGSRSTEWFGSVFGSHSFRLGPAEVDAGVVYHHYSYLDEAGYAAPRVEVSWPAGDAGRTVLKGLLDYRVLAPGSEDLDLLARMVSADFIGTPENAPRGLRAQKTMRSQVSLQQRFGDEPFLVELRVFQEDTVAQLFKAYMKDKPQTQMGPGHFLVWNQGGYRTRGLGLAISRNFGSVASSVGYRFGLARALGSDTARVVLADEEIHDLTTSVQTSIDRTRTRLYAMYRVTSHPSFIPGDDEDQHDLDSRFNFQVYQILPFVGWDGAEWEVMLAVRNLFYQDVDSGAFLDELAVVDSPRRVLGGVSVRF